MVHYVSPLRPPLCLCNLSFIEYQFCNQLRADERFGGTFPWGEKSVISPLVASLPKCLLLTILYYYSLLPRLPCVLFCCKHLFTKFIGLYPHSLSAVPGSSRA
jgi:hypothetical protein